MNTAYQVVGVIGSGDKTIYTVKVDGKFETITFLNNVAVGSTLPPDSEHIVGMMIAVGKY